MRKLEIDSRITFVKIRPGMNILYFDIKGVRTMKTTDLEDRKDKHGEQCCEILRELSQDFETT